jgi:N-carbamoylputrescine amidase
MPVVASNRIGFENVQGQTNGFYGKSFICDRSGEILSEASKDKEEIITAEINIEEDHLFRRNWGLFRDRRVELYKELLTLNGEIKD